jgi:hypothetical protein
VLLLLLVIAAAAGRVRRRRESLWRRHQEVIGRARGERERAGSAVKRGSVYCNEYLFVRGQRARRSEHTAACAQGPTFSDCIVRERRHTRIMITGSALKSCVLKLRPLTLRWHPRAERCRWCSAAGCRKALTEAAVAASAKIAVRIVSRDPADVAGPCVAAARIWLCVQTVVSEVQRHTPREGSRCGGLSGVCLLQFCVFEITFL